MKNKREKVPVAALVFRAGLFNVEPEAGAKVADGSVSLIARSPDAIEHWYWGKVVHDLSGVIVKEKIPLDYSHDTGEVIGYLDSFEVTDSGLNAGGRLVSFTETDRAAEVAYKAGEGVPYEASINFGGDGIEVEQLDEGDTATVNGYELSGPAAVIRSWPLRGVAITPYGADAGTESEIFQADGEEVAVEFLTPNEVKKMANENAEDAAVEDVKVLANGDDSDDQGDEETDDEEQTVEEVVSEAVAGAHVALDTVEEVVTEALADEDEDEDADDEDDDADAEAGNEAGEKKSEAAPATALTQADGKRFVESFGDQGAVWFVEGKTYDECVGLHINGLEAEVQQLRDEGQELRQRLSAVDRGEADPVEFNAAPSSEEVERVSRFNHYNKELGNGAAAAFASRFESQGN